MNWRTIRERVGCLQQEVARIQVKNQQYRTQPHHNRMDEALYSSREVRLVQILEELAALTKKSSCN